MKTTLTLFLFFFLLAPGTGRAQKENNIWIFGDSIGMDFNSGVPVECTSAVYYIESNATVSDPDGKLLFYGAKEYVWDRFHTPMPNGFGILGNELSSSTQGVLILPFINDPDKYYLFTQTAIEMYHSEQMYLRYSVIDMTLNGGRGDVDPARKNIILDSFTTEKMISAIGDSCNLWLIVHRWDTSEIHAFRIDASGLSGTPVVSGFPSARYTKPPVGFYAGFLSGGLGISPDFRTLSNSIYQHGTSIELYDFDRSTGVCSNRRQITGAAAYWNTFSPDGSKLYSSKGGRIVQYDLSLLPSMPAVIASETTVNSPGISNAGMRLGPDGQIYVSANPLLGGGFQVSRIRKPNLKGAACDVQDDIGLFKGSPYQSGLSFGQPVLFTIPRDTFYRARNIFLCDVPSVTYTAPAGYRRYSWSDGFSGRSRVFTGTDTLVLTMRGDCEMIYETIRVRLAKADTSYHSRDTALCFIRPLSFTPPGDRAETYHWQDGDTSSSRTLTGPGRIWLRRTYPPCTVRTDTFVINALHRDTSAYMLDTTACFTNSAILKGKPGYTDYLWNTGDTSRNLGVHAAGIYLLSATDTVSCKTRIDTVLLGFADFDVSLKVIDSLCSGDTLLLHPYVPGASYLWQDGSTDSVYQAFRGGTYTVTVSVGSCSKTRSVQVNLIPFGVSLGNDIIVCEEVDSVVLRPGIGNVNYLWQNGDTGPSFTVRETGRYSVTISKDGCEASDDILVRFIQCDRCLGIPNAFSPNRDGINDVFKPLLHCPVEEYELSIYNRWGQRHFHSSNPADTWDGSYEGKPADSDVYFYMLRIRIKDVDKQPRLLKGDISLVR